MDIDSPIGRIVTIHDDICVIIDRREDGLFLVEDCETGALRFAEPCPMSAQTPDGMAYAKRSAPSVAESMPTPTASTSWPDAIAAAVKVSVGRCLKFLKMEP